MSVEIEILTDELRELVGYGATAHRLPFKPLLRQVCGIEDEVLLPHGTVELTIGQTGNMMRRYLKDAVLSIEPSWFRDRQLQAPTLARCFNLLLGFEGTAQDAPERRRRVMLLTGERVSEVTWRKHRERDFLQLLAEHLWDKGRPKYQMTNTSPADPCVPAYGPLGLTKDRRKRAT